MVGVDEGQEELVLLRPDGHVGLISDAGEVSTVSDYLAAIGVRPQMLFGGVRTLR